MNRNILFSVCLNLDIETILSLKLIFNDLMYYIINDSYFWKLYFFNIVGLKSIEKIKSFNPIVLEEFDLEKNIDILRKYNTLLKFDNNYHKGKCLRIRTKGINRGKYCRKSQETNNFFCDNCLYY